jgi:hypothetical protein
MYNIIKTLMSYNNYYVVIGGTFFILLICIIIVIIIISLFPKQMRSLIQFKRNIENDIYGIK